MAKSVALIGIDPGELPWLRLMLFLLRHPDPVVAEMARRTLVYVSQNAHEQATPQGRPLDQAG